MKKSKAKYDKALPRQMYTFFVGYEDRGAPSFAKFARSVGLTAADVERFRSHKRFDRAYRECQEIRRDYLIDRALDKRFDPSFTKYLITYESEAMSQSEVNNMVFRLEVTE